MSIWTRIRALVGNAPDTEAEPPGSDGAVSSGLPDKTGGDEDRTGVDANSSTGSSPNETIVGRGSGDDAGYLETGAEKRAEE